MAANVEASPIEPPAAPSDVDDGEAPRTRLCGRCRKPSDWDLDAPPAAEAVWFLCPPCRDALIGGVGRARQS